MRRSNPLLIAAVLLSQTACVDALVGPDLANDPETNFRLFWTEFDRLYAFFPDKGVDWDRVRLEYGARIRPSTQPEELLEILHAAIVELDDGHVFISTGDTVVFSTGPERRQAPHHFDLDLVRREYLTTPATEAGGGRIVWGRVGVTGYIHVRSWAGRDGWLSAVGAWVEDFDRVLEALRGVSGLVLDIRDNSGGSFFNGRFLAGRFTAEPTLATWSQFRDGPVHTDFTELEPWFVEPRGPWTFEAPVAVLTNRHSASASEWFALAMGELPQTTLVGTPTAGALGSRIRRELPNGWIYGLPVQRLYTADQRILEEVGVAPDVVVEPPESAIADGHDEIPEAALALLNG